MYLDYAATAPMTAEAIACYEEIAKKYYGNASSLHEDGWLAQQLLTRARQMIADIAGVSSRGLYFTGSGTEANIIGIMSLALASPKKHIVTSLAEHTSVHAAMNALERMGYTITRLPLERHGLIDCETVARAMTDDTCLCAIQHINPEIGAIQPIEQLAELARARGVMLHVDCVQSFAKMKLPFAQHVTSMAFSAHKVGGPKSCGAVYIHPEASIAPLFPGLTHEGGLRGGTVDVAGIGAFAVAAQRSAQTMHHTHYEQLRATLCKQLNRKKYTIIDSKQQYAGICGMYVHGYEGQYVMLKLSEAGVMISTGSACDAKAESGTKTILAMGATVDEGRQFFRISFGPSTTMTNIRDVCQILNAL